jgi:hypothetical protein
MFNARKIKNNNKFWEELIAYFLSATYWVPDTTRGYIYYTPRERAYPAVS